MPRSVCYITSSAGSQSVALVSHGRFPENLGFALFRGRAKVTASVVCLLKRIEIVPTVTSIVFGHLEVLRVTMLSYVAHYCCFV